MNPRFMMLLAICLPPVTLLAQVSIVPFEFQAPKSKPQKSLYRSINFLDARADKTQIGIMGIGVFKNIDGQLVLKVPVQPQLTSILNTFLDSAAGNGELVFQLRQFNFIESYSTKFCFLFATLYTKTGERYQKLLTLDTMIVIGGGDTKKLLTKSASGIVAAFLTEGLETQPGDTISYNLAAVNRIDSIEKTNIPLYTKNILVDGVYKSYSSFASQLPDLQAIVKIKSGIITSVKVPDSYGKKKELKRKELYTVVYNGAPFIVTEFGYYSLDRLGEDFYFTGNIRVGPTGGDLAAAQFAFGLVGTMLTRQGSPKTYRMKIDHLNGDFIHIREIPPPEPVVY